MVNLQNRLQYFVCYKNFGNWEMGVFCVKTLSTIGAWSVLQSDSNSALVDVRTNYEIQHYGAPDLSSLAKKVIFVEWQMMPEMSLNEDFAKDIMALIPALDTKLLFLCKSGKRSEDAAALMSSLHYENCYNVLDGFDGGAHSWKSMRLPWGGC